MPDFSTSIRIDLAGNLVRRSRQYQQSLSRFSKRGRKDLALLRRSTAALGRGLDKMGNRYTSMLAGAAGIGTAKWVMTLERRFTRLGIQANKSVDDMARLKEQIFETARAADTRIDPSELTAAVEEIVEKTGDLEFAERNLDNLAIAIGATGAQGKAIGSLSAEFQKMGIVSRKDVRESLDILTVQGKSGAFTLENLATLGSRVVTAYTSMGRKGIPAIREMGAALQVIRMGTGTSEMAATAFEALLRTLSDPKKVKMLQKGGIQVFDVQALKEGREELRPINELMEEIVVKVKGRKTLLGSIFDAEAVRAFSQVMGEFNRGGEVESLDKLMDVQADGTTILTDSKRAANDASAAMQSLYTSWQMFADAKLTAPIQAMADLLDKLGNKGTDTALTVGATVVGGTLAAVGGRKLMQMGKGMGLGKGAATVAAAAPNYLNNLYGSGKGKPSLAARGAKMLRGATPYLASGAVGYGVGTVIYNEGIKGTELGNNIGEAVAKLAAFFGNEEAKAAVATNAKVDLAIKIDQEGRARVTEISSNSDDVNIDTDVGMVMAP